MLVREATLPVGSSQYRGSQLQEVLRTGTERSALSWTSVFPPPTKAQRTPQKKRWREPRAGGWVGSDVKCWLLEQTQLLRSQTHSNCPHVRGQANQTPSIEGTEDFQASPLTEELLVGNCCWGREAFWFFCFLFFEDVVTGRFSMLSGWSWSYICIHKGNTNCTW